MEDVNDVTTGESVENANIESSNDETETAQINIDVQHPFTRFDDLCDKMLALEDQLLCKEYENEVDEKYGKIISIFSLFQGHFWDTT
jgi:hypothetical protein